MIRDDARTAAYRAGLCVDCKVKPHSPVGHGARNAIRNSEGVSDGRVSSLWRQR